MATLIIGALFVLTGFLVAYFGKSEEDGKGAASWIVLGALVIALRGAVFLGEAVGW